MSTPSAGTGGLPSPRRQWAAFAVSLAVIVAVVDGAMISIAAPTIARALSISDSDSIWMVNASQLGLAIALLPVGKLADTLGHRRVYLACLAVLLIGSLVSASAQSLPTLIVGRFVQGLGAAGVMGVTNAMLRHIYPTDLLGRGIAMNSLVVAIALAGGPIVASALLTVLPWQAIFLVNLPIGAILFVIGLRALPDSLPKKSGFDAPSAIMSALAFGATITAINGVAHGHALLLVAIFLIAGLIAWAALLRRQPKLASPMLPMDLLRIRTFALAVLTLFAASIAQLMAYVAIPFFFQDALGRSQLETGFMFAPWPVAVAAISPLVGRLLNKVEPNILCTVGLAAFAAGLFALSQLGAGASAFDIAWRMALCGLGYGFYLPPNSKSLISSVPLDRVGNANALGASARVLGQAFGAAFVALFFRVLLEKGMAASLLCAALIAIVAAGASVFRGKRAPA